jgi:flagellar basal-body rod protein FlgF
MLSGLYSAATGMNSAAAQHEVIARNLAHANVPGFRRSVVVSQTFESAMEEARQAHILRESWGVADAAIQTDFGAGALQYTESPLDLAIQGDGFFEVAGPDGPLYTRSGTFHRNEAGELVTAEGLALQGNGGPVVIPPEISNTEISIGRDGTVSARGQQFGQINLTRFADPLALQQAGATLFSADGTFGEQAEGQIIQGARELSNVSAVEELIAMIAGLRHYEASQRALRSISDAVAQNTRPA